MCLRRLVRPYNPHRRKNEKDRQGYPDDPLITVHQCPSAPMISFSACSGLMMPSSAAIAGSA